MSTNARDHQPTLNINGLTQTIVRQDGSAVAPGDLPANVLFTARADGNKLRMHALTSSEVAALILPQVVVKPQGWSASRKPFLRRSWRHRVSSASIQTMQRLGT